ncbi:hypothetical protein JCM8097_002504 [Rhodosporidiobolus ruineniae]
MASEDGKDGAPALPPFPDLSPLAASFPSSSPAPSLDPPQDDNPHDIWGSAPSSPPPAPSPAVSTGGYHPAYSVPAPAPPPPPVNLDDLDPFAPSQSGSAAWGHGASGGANATLGSTVGRNSRLELIDSSDEDGSPVAAQDFAPQQQQQGGGKRPGQAELGHKRDGSGSFFSNVFRSISGTPSREQQQAARGTSTPPPLPTPPAEQPPTRAPGEGGDSAASTSSHPHPPSGPAPQTPSGPSTLAKPFTSIASVFRSTPKASPASTAASTPQSGSSPVRDKGAFMTAIVGAGGKGKEKAYLQGGEKEGEPAREYDEKRGPMAGEDGKGKAKEKDEPTFDFNRFLEQMRTRSADPIAKYLRSFLKEFNRRPPISPSDQTRVINDFLDFIAAKMRACDPWKSIVEVEYRHDPERAEAEFDLAMEAMEKLVMNRLWHLTFTPALDLSTFPGHMSPSGDVERDHVLSQRIRLFQWVEPKHLDLPIPSPSSSSLPSSAPTSPNPDAASPPSSPVPPAEEGEKERKPAEGTGTKKGGSGGKQVQGFLDFAQRELCKMNQYKAPRDKLICVLNCCKVIFGLMRHVATGEQGADTFIPFLIYVVLKANPQNLVSNLQYIQRFRNPEKLSGEGGYYLSSLNAAISFIESLDASALSSITQAEFEQHVAEAVKTLAAEEPPPPVPHSDRRPSAFEAASQTSRPTSPTGAPPRFPSPASGDPTQLPLSASEAESASASVVLPSGLTQDGRLGTPISFPESTKQLLLRGTDSVEKAMSKPLGALAKIFEQLEQTANEITGQTPPPAPLPPSPAPSLGLQAGAPPPPPPPHSARPAAHKRRSYLAAPTPVRPGLPPLPPSTGSLHLRQPPSPDPGLYAADDVGDEDVMREIDRREEEQRRVKIGTLESVFPGVEKEVLEMVLLSSGNDVGKAIDSLLEMA